MVAVNYFIRFVFAPIIIVVEGELQQPAESKLANFPTLVVCFFSLDAIHLNLGMSLIHIFLFVVFC